MAPYDESALQRFEAEVGVSIPPALRQFLRIHGPGPYGDVTIYELHEIDSLYRPFFDDPSELFRVYFPFGERRADQEVLIYRLDDQSIASIWHETVPDDWPEEEWIDYGEAALARLTGV